METNQFFDFVMQAYLLTTQTANDLVKNADGLDPHTRKKAGILRSAGHERDFTVELRADESGSARQTLSSNADNLVRGMTMLAEDIEAGHGNLKIRQSAGNLEIGPRCGADTGQGDLPE